MENGTCVVNRKGWVERSREVIQGSYEGAQPYGWLFLLDCV